MSDDFVSSGLLVFAGAVVGFLLGFFFAGVMRMRERTLFLMVMTIVGGGLAIALRVAGYEPPWMNHFF